MRRALTSRIHRSVHRCCCLARTDSCRGKADELEDVRKNQREFTITSFTVEPNPPVDIAFGTFCRNRDRFGDACTYVAVRWQSTSRARRCCPRYVARAATSAAA